MSETAQFNGEVGNIESNINKVDSFDEDISDDAAKKQYPSIACLKNIPHIIESGTSGIWSYRKWSDGTAECWGQYSETVTYSQAYGEYIASGNITPLPTDLFTSINIPRFNSYTTGWCLVGTYGCNKTMVQAGYRRLFLSQLVEGTTDTVKETVSVEIKGRWK